MINNSNNEAVGGFPLACIFDLDGVIVDTAVYHYEAWKRLANSLGFDFTHEQNEQLKGISRMDSLDLVLGWGNTQKTEAEKIQLAQQKNAWYLELVGKMQPDEILPGIREFIEFKLPSFSLFITFSARENPFMRSLNRSV